MGATVAITRGREAEARADVDVSAGVVGQAPAVELETRATAGAYGALSRRNLLIAGLAALGALIFFSGLRWLWGMPVYDTSWYPYYYFTDQARALLHLHWDIGYPGTNIDLIQLNGKWYSIYGLFPSVLMIPFVIGLRHHLSESFIFTALSAVNVGLLYLLFEQVRECGFSRKTWRENLVWAFLLYLGSTALILSLGGGVWYEGHLAACACLLVCLILAFRRHYVWAAVALSCGFHSRSTLLFAFPLLFFLAWEDDLRENLVVPFVRSLWSRRPEWALVPWRRLAGVAAVFAGCIALYLIRNWGMFGNPLESGYGIQLAQHYSFVKDGVFSVRYIPANIVNDFFNFPHITFPTHYSDNPSLDIENGATGISVFLVTPLFLFLFVRNQQRSRLRVALWLTILLSMSFVLMFYTAGYPQFGSRYLFDLFPFAWVILATNDIRMDWRVIALGVFAILLNIWGTYAHLFHIVYFSLPWPKG